MGITVLTPTERRIAGIKKGQSGVVNIPTLTVKQIQKLRTTPTTTPSSGGGGASNTNSSGKKKTTNTNQDQVSITNTTTQTPWDPMDILGAIFPPAQLLNIGQLPPGTTVPTQTITGPPGAINQLTGPTADITAEDNSGLFDGLTKDFGGILKIAIPLIGLGFIASTMKSFKGLF